MRRIYLLIGKDARSFNEAKLRRRFHCGDPDKELLKGIHHICDPTQADSEEDKEANMGSF
jgi:hypothetical protein